MGDLTIRGEDISRRLLTSLVGRRVRAELPDRGVIGTVTSLDGLTATIGETWTGVIVAVTVRDHDVPVLDLRWAEEVTRG